MKIIDISIIYNPLGEINQKLMNNIFFDLNLSSIRTQMSV
jgi:hypothetical protein